MKFTTRVKPVKIRIISGGEEHSNLDTLRRNFFIPDIIELVKDNRFSTWLRRIKAEEMASRIEEARKEMESGECRTEKLALKLSNIVFGTNFDAIDDLKFYWKKNNYIKTLHYFESDEAIEFIDKSLRSLGNGNLYKKVIDIIDNIDRIEDSKRNDYRKNVLDSFDENLSYRLYKELQIKEGPDRNRVEVFFVGLDDPTFKLRYNKEEYSRLIASFDKEFIRKEYLTRLLRLLTIINDRKEESNLLQMICKLDEGNRLKFVETLKYINDKELGSIINRIRKDVFDDINVINNLTLDGYGFDSFIRLAVAFVKKNWESGQDDLARMITKISSYHKENKEGQGPLMALIILLAIHYQIRFNKIPDVDVLQDIQERGEQKWRYSVLKKIPSEGRLARLRDILKSICIDVCCTECYGHILSIKKRTNQTNHQFHTYSDWFGNYISLNDKSTYIISIDETGSFHEFKVNVNSVPNMDLDGCLKFILDNFEIIVYEKGDR